MSRARKKLVHKTKRKKDAFRAAVGEHARAMEEPLRHAANLVRAIEIAYRPDDDEMEALSFVAGEAFMRLEFVEEELRGLFKIIEDACP